MTMNQAQPAIKTMSKKTSAADKLDPIAVFREELTAVAICHGVRDVDTLTDAYLHRVVQRLGGVQVYVPSERTLNRERVVQEIRASFNGRNLRELAVKYGLSVRWVRSIVG